MASREPANILILGGSYAGLSVAHQFLRKTIHSLYTTETAPRYRVLLVSPSTHFYWNIGAPRLISSRSVKENDAFLPIQNGFDGYSTSQFKFIHGRAIAVNFSRRTVDIQLLGRGSATDVVREYPYHALILATGCTARSDLLSLQGNHQKTVDAIRNFQETLSTSSSIVIVGGGTSGVECAGQLATWINKEQKRIVNPSLVPVQKNPRNSALIVPPTSTLSPSSDGFKSEDQDTGTALQITLISGHSRLLPRLSPEIGQRAEKQLKSIGVNVLHNVRLIAAQRQQNNLTHCILSNDMILAADLFISATGVQPNTSFLPAELLNSKGYLQSDSNFCRVPRVGERVYAIGSVTTHSNSLQGMYRALPILLHNLKNDLIAFEIKTQPGYGDGEELLKKLRDALVEGEKSRKDVSVFIPITRWGGVGIIKGHSVPPVAVWALKGKDYGFKNAKKVVNSGTNPFTA